MAKSGIEGIKLQKGTAGYNIARHIYAKYGWLWSMPDTERRWNTKSIPVLMVSAYGNDTKVRVKGLNAGADAFITKPYQMSEFCCSY